MTSPASAHDPQHVYRLLKLGLGHELVDDRNVFALIELARRDGHVLLETELREWQASCSAADARPRPPTAPTAGSAEDDVRR